MTSGSQAKEVWPSGIWSCWPARTLCVRRMVKQAAPAAGARHGAPLSSALAGIARPGGGLHVVSWCRPGRRSIADLVPVAPVRGEAERWT